VRTTTGRTTGRTQETSTPLPRSSKRTASLAPSVDLTARARVVLVGQQAEVHDARVVESTSSGPRRSSTMSRNWRIDARLETSSSTAIVPCASSAAVRLAAATSRSPIATCIPVRTHACAVARPMPRAPPVIATMRPARSRVARAMARSRLQRTSD
jgi:hypothetical protein